MMIGRYNSGLSRRHLNTYSFFCITHSCESVIRNLRLVSPNNKKKVLDESRHLILQYLFVYLYYRF